MRGIYDIEIYNATVHYFLTVRRNITIIQGNSASGKSELVRLLGEYNRSRESSGITLKCDVPCTVVESDDWESRIRAMHGRIIFIDEGNSFVKTREFARTVEGSDNYFVIIDRDDLHELPYSINEIYGLREADPSKYKQAEQVYNEIYQLYTSVLENTFQADSVITEDSQSGYQFFRAAFGEDVVTAYGKSKVLAMLRQSHEGGKKAVAIVDGAAFGPEMNRVHEWLKWHDDCAVFAPESFEYLVLSSGVIDVPDKVLTETYNYADSMKYMSWEQFYTAYLIQMTNGTQQQYMKSRLAEYYKTEGSIKMILSTLPGNLLICDGKLDKRE